LCSEIRHCAKRQTVSGNRITDGSTVNKSNKQTNKKYAYRHKSKITNAGQIETKEFYIDKLKFSEIADYGDYLLIRKDSVEIHFFEFNNLDPKENYGQAYIRTNDIDILYQTLLDSKIQIHPNGQLETKPWAQREFALLDPDNNLLTFAQSLK